MLIYIAMPNATRVAGFRTWKTLGRSVKKGVKALKILAPMMHKNENDEEEIVNFLPVNVFDISQTEGQPLPKVGVDLVGDDKGELLERLMACKQKQITVEFKNLGVNEVYGYSKGGMVVISETGSVNTKVNTLIHEIAHEVLHHKDDSLSRLQREIQAEGTAYVVAKHFGLETTSPRYLAMYGADHVTIMANLQAIAEASREMIEFISLTPLIPNFILNEHEKDKVPNNN